MRVIVALFLPEVHVGPKNNSGKLAQQDLDDALGVVEEDDEEEEKVAKKGEEAEEDA
jgi:hypothetical protein